MKGFPRRLFFYAIGLGFGILFSIYLVKGKMGGELPEFCYLPNCRVLKALRSQPISIQTHSHPACPLTEEILSEILNEGKVLFSRSEARKEPCGEYLVAYREYEILFRKCEDSTRVIQSRCSSPAGD